MSVLTTFIVKKIQTWTEPKTGKDEPKPNREFWTAGNRDISVNRDSPTMHLAYITFLHNRKNFRRDLGKDSSLAHTVIKEVQPKMIKPKIEMCAGFFEVAKYYL